MNTTCITYGCEREIYTRGLCRSCYQRARRYIAAGETTWDELLKLGLCHPKKGRVSKFTNMINNIVKAGAINPIKPKEAINANDDIALTLRNTNDLSGQTFIHRIFPTNETPQVSVEQAAATPSLLFQDDATDRVISLPPAAQNKDSGTGSDCCTDVPETQSELPAINSTVKLPLTVETVMEYLNVNPPEPAHVKPPWES